MFVLEMELSDFLAGCRVRAEAAGLVIQATLKRLPVRDRKLILW